MLRIENRRQLVRALPLLIVPLFLVVASSSGHAAPGVIEINQTCAIQTGCLPGDTPGFPVTLDDNATRSVRLTSTLVVSDPNVDAIRIGDTTTGTFSIDLGGFEIRGPTDCTLALQSQLFVQTCAPAGIGAGIRKSSLGVALSQLTVENGVIRGMASAGVLANNTTARIRQLHVESNGGGGVNVGRGSILEHVSAIRNGEAGIAIGLNSTLRDCTTRENESYGIRSVGGSSISRCTVDTNLIAGVFLGSGDTLSDSTVLANQGDGVVALTAAIIRGNVVAGNIGDGIDTGGRGVIDGNTVTSSQGVGIRTSMGSVVTNNLVADSDEDGIFARDGSTLRGNSTLDNGTTTDHDGVYCTLGCTVQGNTARANAGAGLRFDTQSSVYSGNSIGSNGAGTVVNGQDGGGNVCETTLGCP